MGDLFDSYMPLDHGPGAGAYDEAFTCGGESRPASREMVGALAHIGREDLGSRSARLARAFRDQGVTFDLDGEERPFPLDVVPRVFTEREWHQIQDGVSQRVRALEAFLGDVYGPQRILDDGIMPRSVVTASPNFLRAAYGIAPPNGVRVQVAGIDVVRDADGSFKVLEDNIRCPSGVSYVLANRRAMTRVLPEIFRGQPIFQVADYPARLVAALRASAPPGVTDPTVVVLTPGVYNSAFFEHALLARLMGVELVEGRDLVCRGTDVYLRTTDGEVRVHVVYRRIDDSFLDPLQFLPESVVGCPGLVNAARAGNVTIANAVGNGIADDKMVYCWVPDMIRYYLDEDPVLQNVETYRLFDDEDREKAFKRRHELVFKPVDGSGGKGIVLGPSASKETLDAVEAAIRSEPRGWVAQPLVRLSTSPTWTGEEIAPRHVDFRPFAVNDGEKVWVLPGGLTRVALAEGGMIVNSSQGGGSKDTWVIGGNQPQFKTRPATPPPVLQPVNAGPPMDHGPSGPGGHEQ